MRRLSNSATVRWLARVLLALTAAISLASPAAACHPTSLQREKIKILWDDPPAIGPGEVAVKVRFLREETIVLRRNPSAGHITILCNGPQPPPSDEVKVTVSVYQVISPPKGTYRSSTVTILDMGYEYRFADGWMVGRPARIDLTKRGLPLEGTPLPEPWTIAWRLPSCPPYHYCPAFNPNTVKFDE